MKKNIITTVYIKEILDTIRDRKTLVSSLLLPVLLIPVLILGMTKIQMMLADSEKEKQLNVVIEQMPAGFEQALSLDSAIVIKTLGEGAAPIDSVNKENIDGYLKFSPDFLTQIDSLKSGGVDLYVKSTNTAASDRISKVLDSYKADLLATRIQKINFNPVLLEPMRINKVDLASDKEQFGKFAGGFLPYIFVIMCFLGCLYPGLDVTSGEKERGTLETLLTVPASRFQIIIGKVLAVATFGFIAAALSTSSMFLAVQFIEDIPQELIDLLVSVLTPQFILLLMCMIIPLSIFFAALICAIAIRANSFKEAQSYVTPLNFVIILPAAIAMTPGIAFDWTTVFIPILNISLATKEIIAGTIDYTKFAVLMLTLIGLALVSVMFSVKEFSKEKNILK